MISFLPRGILCLFVLFFTVNPTLLIGDVGSNTAPSRQQFITFTSLSSSNKILGFAALEKGFRIPDNSTTCTYSSYFPIGGRVDMNGGALYLLKDLVISNSCSFVSSGRFYGNAFSIEFGKQLDDFALPAADAPFSLITTASITMNDQNVLATDWSRDDRYVAAGSALSGSSELKVYYFDGARLTTTNIMEIGRAVNTVAWNPKSNYLATGQGNGPNPELRNFSFNRSNGTLNVASTQSYGGTNIFALDWHPTGSYLAVGTDKNSRELQVYPVNQTTGVIGSGVTLNISPSRSAQSVSWAPGGVYLVTGFANSATAGAAEVVVSSFDGASLTITTSSEIGNSVQSVDWSPTGTYIAVGITGLTTNLRVYKHSLANNTLLEAQTARQTLSSTVQTVHWDKTGNYLLVGLAAGASSAIRVYYFDKTTERLSLINTISATTNVNSVRWNNTRNYFAFGQGLLSTGDIFVIHLDTPYFLYRDTNLVFNSNVNINSSLIFQGNCKIDGRGKVLTLQELGQITVQPGANLIFEDVEIEGVSYSKIRCLTDAGSVTFRNSIIELSTNYTFSQGSILFDEDVMVTGTSIFNYTTGLTSSVNSNSTLYLGLGTTFSYAPRLAQQNLLNFTDNTAVLFCNGCTLHSTRTGLSLSNGTIVIDDTVTFSSEAQFKSSAMKLNSNVNIQVLNGATLNLQGLIRYD